MVAFHDTLHSAKLEMTISGIWQIRPLVYNRYMNCMLILGKCLMGEDLAQRSQLCNILSGNKVQTVGETRDSDTVVILCALNAVLWVISCSPYPKQTPIEVSRNFSKGL